MLNYNLKTVLLIGIVFSLAFGYVFAQKPPMKALERIQSIKKVKLLEVLELSEAESDKFLVKYNEYEKNVLDKYRKLEESSQELHKAIINEDYKNIDKLNENYMNANKELNQAIQDKYENVKKLLPKEKFAKYLIFERQFQNELRKQIFKRMGDKDDKEPPMKRRKFGDF